jgi:hypothetical protein
MSSLRALVPRRAGTDMTVVSMAGFFVDEKEKLSAFQCKILLLNLLAKFLNCSFMLKSC